ncbi:MAG TPA: DUF58 domain-containing protein, partial [Planctomycetes bacterium]|nr:DUF58 domain-containing protein [Planctomycetota bacterium]
MSAAGEQPRRDDDRTPGLAPELMARVRRIQIRTHRMVSGALQGAYRSNFRGTGIEFEEVRPYQPGDEVRSIDWNVTARTGEPHIKTYQEERQLLLHLVVDAARSMEFSSTDRSKLEVAAEVAALLAFVAAHNQDQVGLSLASCSDPRHLPADRGTRHVLRIVREVVGARSAPSRAPLGDLIEEQLKHLRRRSLVFLISDFLGIEDREHFADALARLARAHDVLCVRVFDPFEEELPDAGVLLLEDAEGKSCVEVDTSSARVRAAWKRDAEERR